MSKTTTNILLIEDNPGDARLVTELLKEATSVTTNISQVSTLRAANINFQQHKYDVVLLDLNLPDSRGIETVTKAREIVKNVPIVVMTGVEDEELSLASIRAGAQDYLVKGTINTRQLLQTLRYAMQRNTLLLNLEEVNNKSQTYMATHDLLTGLPKQQSFIDILQHVINKHNMDDKFVAVIVLHVNDIIRINDEVGSQYADIILKAAADFLTKINADFEYIARLNSGSDFALLVSNIPSTTAVDHTIQQIEEAFSSNPILFNEREYLLSTNIGISLYPFDGMDADTLLTKARSAMQYAKQLGSNKYLYFLEKMTHSKKMHYEHLILSSDLQLALNRNEFFLLYQPQVEIKNQKIIGAEALLRWRHPKLGLIPVGDFIPIAESSGLITPIGSWVIETCCKQIKIFQAADLHSIPFVMGINVSINQLKNIDLYKVVKSIIRDYKIPAQFLELELTESAFIEDPESAITELKRLRQLGVSIAIDDFGTGYSSLSYLSHLPINKVKIGDTFIKNFTNNKSTQIVISSIISLAHSLQLKVIAEGVETLEQYQLLKQQGCDEIQGFYFHKPMPIDALIELLKKQENNFNLEICPK
ncbi:hypothetical protein BH10PSE19_BH10PSE19_09130 [soil metagenome]